MLEGLLTSRTRIAVLKFLLFKKQSTYLREISNSLKLPVSAVSREIKNLGEVGIIKKDADVISINKKCPFITDLKNIFVKTEYILLPIKEAVKGFDITFAFIFGSFGNGKSLPYSDIDLFLIGRLDSLQLTKLLRPAEKIIGREINPVIWSLDELRDGKKKSFIRDIAKSKIIMVKGNENELRKIIGRR